MKYIKTFESLEEGKYLIQLSSANSGGIMNMTNPSELIKKEAEEWWSLNVNFIEKLEMQSRYHNLSNDMLAKLIGCRSDVERFGSSYPRPANMHFEADLSEQDIKRFRYTGTTDTKCVDAHKILSRRVSKFKRMKLDQKLSFFGELESDDFLVIRNSYIYKVVDVNNLMDEVISISNKLDIISEQ